MQALIAGAVTPPSPSPRPAHLCMQVGTLVSQAPSAPRAAAAAAPSPRTLQLIARHRGAMVAAGRPPCQGQARGRGALQLQAQRRRGRRRRCAEDFRLAQAGAHRVEGTHAQGVAGVWLQPAHCGRGTVGAGV